MNTKAAIATLLAMLAPAISQAEIILSLKGAACCAGANEAHFSPEALAALPQAKIVTKTPWTEGLHTYQGVKLSTLLANNQLKSTAVTIRALNNYWASIPASVIEKYQPLLATHADGVALTRRNKGPIWVILPLSAHPEIDTERFHSYMVWQTRSIEAE